MLRIFSRLGEVSVGVFNTRILIAVAKRLRESESAVVLMLFFRGTLGAVRIICRNLGHIAPFAPHCDLRARTIRNSEFLQPLARL